MYDTTRLGRVLPAAALAALLGASAALPALAYADPAAWPTGTNSVESVTQDKDGHYEEKASSTMGAKLSSVHGTWKDSNSVHDNGKYVVTVPTNVGFKNVDAGAVDLTAPYTVNVAGILEFGDSVTCEVSYDPSILTATKGAAAPALMDGTFPYSARTDGSDLKTEVTQGKTTWTDAETSVMDSEGRVIGTESADSVHFTGTVRSVSTFTNPVKYSFSTAYANSGASYAKGE